MRATGKLARGLVVLAALAGSAAAQPIWAERPSAADLQPFYPEKTDGPDEGVVRIRCAVADDGRLSQCVVMDETPPGYGLGAWALTIAPKFRATPEAAANMKGSVTIPIRFTGRDDPPLRAARFQIMAGYRDLGVAGPFYPKRAARVGATAVVLVDCQVGPKDRLTRCKVARTTNPDFGFEDAVLKMAEKGWMTAGAAPDGATPPDGVWRFRVVFDRRRR